MPGTAPLDESRGHTFAGHSGQKELEVLLRPLPPAACSIPRPSSLHIDYLAVPSESTNSWK